MAQPTEPSKLRRYMGAVRPGAAAVGGAALGAFNAANEVNDIRTNYGQAAADEAAPGIAAGNIAGGAAFAAEPPRMLQRGVSRALGSPGMREFAKTATNTLNAAPKPPAGASVKLGGLRSTLQRGVMPTLRQTAGRAAGNLVGGTLRRTPGAIAVYGNAKGAADSFVDNNTGYADEYAKQMGMDGSASGAVGASVLRTLENVGNAATGGYAARLGQGIGTALGGGTFSEGWNKTPAREAYYEKRRQAQAAAEGIRASGAPIDLKFRDESTPPESFYKTPPKTPAPPKPTDAAPTDAARINAPPERVTAYGFQDANKAEAAGMRSAARILDYGANARSNIVNGALGGYGGFMGGNTDELMRRMEMDLTSYKYKGFPSLRAARAEMWNNLINSANGATAKGADNAAAADMQGMQDANESQRAFSDRRNKVDMFNVGTSEERRAGDLDRAVTHEGNTLRALASGARGADKYADPSFAGKLYEDYLKIYKDPALAAQMANRGSVAAGETADSPVTAMAQTADADNLQRGMRDFAGRWFGFGNRAFDANSAQPVDQAGFWDSILPGGVEYGDLKLRDAQGNETWAPGASLPAGEDFTSFSQRLARQRELARLRNEGK